MRNASFLTLVLTVVVMFGACDGEPERRSPLPSHHRSCPLPSLRRHNRHRRLLFRPGRGSSRSARKDRLVDQDKHFVVTAPSHGTLAVRLTVPPEVQDSGAMVLRLKLNGTDFPSGCCGWDYPVLAGMTVVTGQQVLVAVSNAGGYWDYRQVGPRADEGLPFVLSTALQ